MKISKQARREAKQLFRSTLRDGLLDENRARQVVQHVLKTKPRGFLSILAHFERLLKLDVERRTAKVESAQPLSNDAQAAVKDRLAQVYGPGLHISFAQNPGLIGGMRIRIGSDVYDGSIQARLAALQESF
jgi:F-type H+-transporting ATPase subunit delta